MLTAKLVEHNGEEQIFEVKKVWAERATEPNRTQDHNVHARDAEDEVLHFGSYGILYVMNDGGQTVARYHLGYGEQVSSPLVTQ